MSGAGCCACGTLVVRSKNYELGTSDDNLLVQLTYERVTLCMVQRVMVQHSTV